MSNLMRRLMVGLVGLMFLVESEFNWQLKWIDRSDLLLVGAVLVIFAALIWEPRP